MPGGGGSTIGCGSTSGAGGGGIGLSLGVGTSVGTSRGLGTWAWCFMPRAGQSMCHRREGRADPVLPVRGQQARECRLLLEPMHSDAT